MPDAHDRAILCTTRFAMAADAGDFPIMSRSRTVLSILLTMATSLSFPELGEAGSWKLEFDSREHPSLTYSEDGKIIFLLGCGHAFALQVKYPGTPKTSGSASLTISNTRASARLRGEFEEPAGETKG